MTRLDRRIAREKRTIHTMIEMHCRGRHGMRHGLCAPCAGLQSYADRRIDRCPWLPNKPTCAACPVHCYKSDRREEARQMMRWSGPRMLWTHPILTLLHYLDEWSWRPDETLKARLTR